MPRFLARLLAVALGTFAIPASAQTSPPTPTDYNTVIVGGRTALPTPSDVLALDRYWVVLGAARPDGTVAPLSAEGCAASSVAFTLGVPAKPGESPPSDTTTGVVVSWTVLASPEWGAMTDQQSTFPRVARAAGENPTEAIYCVAYASPRLAETGSAQTVTARVIPPKGGTQTTLAEARFTSAEVGGPGGVYQFSPRRITPTRLVIVGRSVGRGYALAGTQARGTYAVILGAWNAELDRVEPPSVAACRAAKVRFSLFAPTSTGPEFPSVEVGAVWVDVSQADRLFRRTTARYVEDQSRPEALQAPATRAALAGADAPDQTYGRAPFFCVAQAPMLLGENVGEQQIFADVVSSGPATDVVEGLLQPGARSSTFSGDSILLGDRPGQQARFKPVRVHALPRVLFGVAASRSNIYTVESDTSGSGNDGKTSAVAGFDFPLEPAINGTLRALGVQANLETTVRVGATANLTGDAFDTIFFNLSMPSLFSLAAASSPIDALVGVGIRNDGSAVAAGSLVVDLDGALKGLKGAFGL